MIDGTGAPVSAIELRMYAQMAYDLDMEGAAETFIGAAEGFESRDREIARLKAALAQTVADARAMVERRDHEIERLRASLAALQAPADRTEGA